MLSAHPRGSTALVLALVLVLLAVGAGLWYFLGRDTGSTANVNLPSNTNAPGNANTANANEDAELGVTPAPATVNSSEDLTAAEAALNVNLDAGTDSAELTNLSTEF